MQFELKISPDKEMIETAMLAVKAYSGHYVSDPKELSRLNLALEEAIANVLNYSLTDSLEFITVKGEAEDGELKLSVLDKGLPGNYEETLTDEESLGLTLMQHSVDQVNIKNLGRDGRCQELVKYYCHRPDYSAAAPEPAAAAPEKPAAASGGEIRIIPMRKEDALMVGRGLYAEYGFSYGKDIAYYPERLYAAVRKGELYSAVAVNEAGKAVGHMAAWEWEDIPGIWESGMAVTDASCRGSGVFGKLLAHIVEYVETQTDAKLHLGVAVTSHPYSQKGAYHYGSRPFAFAMNVHGADALASSFKTQEEIANERDTNVYMGWILDHDRKTVYAVPEVKEILAGRYAAVGAERDIVTDELEPEADSTQSELHFKPQWQHGRICVFQLGRDFAECLSRDLLSMKRNGAFQVELCISMDRPGVSAAYEAAKKQGFFFTGVLPGSKKGDIMVMYKMLSHTVNYDRIRVHEAAAELLERVRALDPDQK